jgi:hypothetical protein
MKFGRRLSAVFLAVPLALALGVTAAQAAPVYADTSVTADHQVVDAITAIDAEASWNTTIASPCPITTSPLGSADTLVPVPSHMCVQFSKTGGGTPAWSIASENNIPPAALISLNPTTGLLTVTPTSTPVVAANNQNITLTVKVTDGAATAFETLTAQPIIIAGGVIIGIHVTAVTDSVTLAGANNNVTGAVDFTSTPAGAGFALANNPPGTALSGNHLAGTSAIPSTEDYGSVSVTATDAMGATAVDTFKLDVYGGVLTNDTPRLSGGHAVRLNAVRENVYFVQSGQASCDHFTIVGPGKINGHEGWVPAHLGLNVAVYGGLEAHHGYTVYYQPVTGPADCSGGSTTLWPGAHWGYVYFVS